MITFGLITEGITDQIVIENILCGYFDKNEDHIEFRELQPLRDETDENRAKNYGGWDKVIEYCESDEFKEALQFHDYIIVQIDTDVSDKPDGYGIPHYENGEELSPEQLIEKVIAELFMDLIGEHTYKKHQNKIIFAISVHSIECWLLPLYYSDNRKAKIVNCTDTIDEKLKKSSMKIRLVNKKGEKYVESYRKISEKYRKHLELTEPKTINEVATTDTVKNTDCAISKSCPQFVVLNEPSNLCHPDPCQQFGKFAEPVINKSVDNSNTISNLSNAIYLVTAIILGVTALLILFTVLVPILVLKKTTPSGLKKNSHG